MDFSVRGRRCGLTNQGVSVSPFRCTPTAVNVYTAKPARAIKRTGDEFHAGLQVSGSPRQPRIYTSVPGSVSPNPLQSTMTHARQDIWQRAGDFGAGRRERTTFPAYTSRPARSSKPKNVTQYLDSRDQGAGSTPYAPCHPRAGEQGVRDATVLRS